MLSLLLVMGCAPEVLDAPAGSGPGPVEQDGRVTESFVDGFGPVDMVFVVDQTPDAAYLVGRLSDAAPAFFAEVADLDVQVGVIKGSMSDPTQGQGKLLVAGGSAFTRSTDPDPASIFQLQLAQVGQEDSSSMRARAALWTLVELKRDIARNQGFLRGGPVIAVVVSNDAERSGANPISSAEFAEWAYEENVSVHGIVPVGTGCEDEVGSVFGDSFHDEIEALGGQALDVCATDFTPLFEQLSTLVRRAQGELLLERPAVADSIRVSIDFEDQPIELQACAGCDVSYVPERNAVRLDLVVPNGTPIEVSYTERR